MSNRRIVRARRQCATSTTLLTAPGTVQPPPSAIQICIFKDIVNSNGLLLSHYSIDNIINNAIIIFNLNLESEYNYQMIDNIFRNIQSNIK